MGEFKEVISVAMGRYITEFQVRKSKISDSDIYNIVEDGGKIAKENAKQTIKEVRRAMQLVYIS
jgi:hypothetical protein